MGRNAPKEALVPAAYEMAFNDARVLRSLTERFAAFAGFNVSKPFVVTSPPLMITLPSPVMSSILEEPEF